ncbi:MAG: hypothetical protein HYU30_06465 [Chloroflexi bacterium]|nr:hypothetical protein [Chloroflexota bacterium]
MNNVFPDVAEYLKGTYQQVVGHLHATEQFGHFFHQPFVVIVNRVIISTEMLEAVFLLGQRPAQQPLTADEMRSRLTYLFRDMLFVGSMSTMEYYLIQILMSCPHHPAHEAIQKKGGPRRVGLPDFMPWLQDSALWEFAIQFRNDAVHYNAVGRRTIPSPQQLDFPIIVTEGQEAQGVLRSFVALTKALEMSYYNLLTSLSASH